MWWVVVEVIGVSEMEARFSARIFIRSEISLKPYFETHKRVGGKIFFVQFLTYLCIVFYPEIWHLRTISFCLIQLKKLYIIVYFLIIQI